MHSALTKTAAFFGPKIFAVSLSVLGSCLEDSEKLLKKAWKMHRGTTKVPTKFLFLKIMRLNMAKLTSGESVYTSFGKPRKMDSI